MNTHISEGDASHKPQTDIERLVADPRWKEQVKEVARIIEARGIKHVYFQFVSVTGRVMGKSVPARHWESVAAKGIQLWYGAVADVQADRW